jgi:phosphohistidine phosphatase
LVLVGHEPDLGDLAARLIGAPSGTITLKKAGVALLSLGSGLAQLRLLAGPKQLLGP